jgi:hypothetical protein
MSGGLSTTAVDRLLTDTRAALDRMRTTPAMPTDPGATDVDVLHADGIDPSGRVSVTVTLPGRISALTMDPRIMREGSTAVCDAIIEAVNDGLASLQTLALRGVPSIDVESLAADLERVQTESLHSASTMLTALQDTMSRIHRQV